MPFATTADAVAREAAWLTTSGDTLPALLATANGKWDVVQAYAPRSPAQRKNQIWVMRRRTRLERVANIRRRAHYEFELALLWNLSAASGNAESDQAAFDAAIDDVLTRIGGPMQDKTHGGRFLSVAEDPTLIDVEYVSADRSMAASAAFEARIRYEADDFDFNG